MSHAPAPPAIEALLASPVRRVQLFLLASHGCSVMGTQQYDPLTEKHRVPMVVTGFEPVDVLKGVRRAVVQFEAGGGEGGERLRPSCGFILQEGLPLPVRQRVGADMGAATTAAGMRQVTGDTPVIDTGAGDVLFVPASADSENGQAGVQGGWCYSPRNLRLLVGDSPIAASSPRVKPWERLMPT